MKTEHTPSTRDVIVSMAFAFAVLIAVSLAALLILGQIYGPEPPTSVLSATLLVLNPVSIGLCGLYFARIHSQEAGALLGLVRARLWLLVPGVLLGGQVSDALYRWIHQSAGGLDGGSIDSLTAAVRESGFTGAMILLGALVLAPVGEELFFRGWVYGALEKRGGGRHAIWISGVAFAAYHMDPAHSIAILPLALWLSWLRWATGSILPCILAHGINNALWVLSTRLWPDAEPLAYGFTLLSLLGLVAMFYFVRQKAHPAAM